MQSWKFQEKRAGVEAAFHFQETCFNLPLGRILPIFFFSVRETIIYESGHEVRNERDRTIYQEQDQLSIN